MKNIKLHKLPTHVAIIMDGNGRWAKKRGLLRIAGHQEGVKRAKEIVETAREMGIKVLTLYTFSYENWQRPEEEVNFLMRLLEDYVKKEHENLLKKDIRLQVIGELELLPERTYDVLQKAMKDTAHCQSMILNLAISYGGRQEILQAVRSLIKADMRPEDVSLDTFKQFLWTKELPDPDLIIRTGGEIRISNFLLWQSAYAEFYFTSVLWPDFHKEDFIRALNDYQKRERRFGKISEQLK